MRGRAVGRVPPYSVGCVAQGQARRAQSAEGQTRNLGVDSRDFRLYVTHVLIRTDRQKKYSSTRTHAQSQTAQQYLSQSVASQ